MSMMRWLILGLLLTPLWGQSGTTLVTGQVKDVNNSLYVNCTWSTVFVGENAATGTGPYFPDRYVQGQQGGCDSNANFTVNLGDNVLTITPTPSQWQFNICSTTGYVPGNQFCFQFLQTVTGAALNLTPVIQQIAPVLPQSPQSIVRLNNSWTGSNIFLPGAQFGPPALPEVDIAIDQTGTCQYPFNILTAGQAHICNLPNATLGLNYGLFPGYTQFFTVRPPSIPPTVNSIPAYTTRGDWEIVTQPWAYMLNAYCTGVVGTGNATTYILVPGGNGTTCTITNASEMPMAAPCVAQSLYTNSSAGGAVAGSGVMTLYKNGTATALTCTMGTGTTCSDTTDTVSFVAGDLWSVRVTTGQATDTTANARASFLCQ